MGIGIRVNSHLRLAMSPSLQVSAGLPVSRLPSPGPGLRQVMVGQNGVLGGSGQWCFVSSSPPPNEQRGLNPGKRERRHATIRRCHWPAGLVRGSGRWWMSKKAGRFGRQSQSRTALSATTQLPRPASAQTKGNSECTTSFCPPGAASASHGLEGSVQPGGVSSVSSQVVTFLPLNFQTPVP